MPYRALFKILVLDVLNFFTKIPGMYGDLPASSSSHKDLIPLIEKLIDLLKSSAGKDQFVRVLAGAVPAPQGATLVQTMEHMVKRPAVIQSSDMSSRKPTSKIRLVLPGVCAGVICLV